MILSLIVIFTLLGSIFSVGGAGLLLLFKGERLRFVTNILVPYAIGTLLGAAFFGYDSPRIASTGRSIGAPDVAVWDHPLLRA